MSYYVIVYEIYVLFIISYIVPCILYICDPECLTLCWSPQAPGGAPTRTHGWDSEETGGAGGVDAGVHVPSLPLWMQPLGRLLKLNFATFFEKTSNSDVHSHDSIFWGKLRLPIPFLLSLLLLAHWDPPKGIPQQLLTTITYQFYVLFNPQRVTMWICSTCQMSDHLDGTKSSANLFILNLCISHDCLLRPS